MSKKPTKSTALVPSGQRKPPAKRKPAALTVVPATAETLLPALRSELALAKLVGTGGELEREDGVVLVTGRAYATRECIVPAEQVYYDRASRHASKRSSCSSARSAFVAISSRASASGRATS